MYAKRGVIMDYLKLLQTTDEAHLDEYLKIHDVDEETHGQILLYWAVYLNNVAFTKKLVNEGADVNKKDALVRSSLQIACFFEFNTVAEFLLKNGAILDDSCLERAKMGYNSHKQTEIIDLIKKWNKDV